VIRKRRRILRWAGILGIVLLAAVALAAFFPQKILCVDSGPVQADVIVVLGGDAAERSDRAAELFRNHAAPRIIVSGEGDDGINRRILLKAGVPARAIELESKSRTTRENAAFTVKLLRAENVRRVILVTSWYHSRRALHCFEHAAPDIRFYSRPSYFAYAGAVWRRPEVARRVYLEYPKLLGYWLCYGVCPF
jgi:uncharacterized SAM-binding protein YcdF (DUF218 family)